MDNTTSLQKKLADIQNKLNVPKNQLNKFGGYKYRSAEDILNGVKPLLGDCVLVVFDDLILVGDRYYVKATARIALGEDVIETSAFAREEEVKKGMDASQITGSASSYARKYALNGLFCIDDTQDADTRDNSEITFPKEMKPFRTPENMGDAPKATQSQKDLMLKLKLDFNEDISLQEASELISSKIGKKDPITGAYARQRDYRDDEKNRVLDGMAKESYKEMEE